MGNRKATYVTIALSLLFFAALLFAQHILKQDRTFPLPEQSTETGTTNDSHNSDGFNALSVSPQTVQAAISTLSRPAAYERVQTVETFWSAGKSTSTAQVAVSGGKIRIDATLSDSSVLHTLINGESAAVWYDDEMVWRKLRTSSFSSDSLQRMPTYETVLELSVAQIEQAEYCEKDGIWCIRIQTRPDAEGYADAYWVSSKSGLLLSAERTFHGDLIYRFTASEPESKTPNESLFLLPDGSELS